MGSQLPATSDVEKIAYAPLLRGGPSLIQRFVFVSSWDSGRAMAVFLGDKIPV